VAWFAGMIDQAAWMRKTHAGFRSEHMEHVTKKLALATAKRTVGRPLAGHLERHPIGGPTAPICGRRVTSSIAHQPQASLTNQLVHDQGQRPTLQPGGPTAGVVGPRWFSWAVVRSPPAVIGSRLGVLHRQAPLQVAAG
jgi:hypothetical protein